MKKLSLIICLLYIGVLAGFGQNAQFNYKVFITDEHIEKQKIKYKAITTGSATSVTLPKKITVIKRTVNYIDSNQKAATATILDTLKNDLPVTIPGNDIDTIINADNRIVGKASIIVDAASDSILHINPWLFTGQTPKVYAAEIRKTRYFMTLENREFVSFKFSSWEAGTISIPFKYRPSLSKNEKNISDDLSADVNLGIYLGKVFGRIRYKYIRNEKTKPSKWLVSCGPVIGFSRVTLNADNTLGATKPFDDKTTKNIGTIGLGLGISTSYNDFRVGFYAGKDWGIGSSANSWDYHDTMWYGIGIGYQFGLFAAKSD
jgi:predicted transcriptional regulator